MNNNYIRQTKDDTMRQLEAKVFSLTQRCEAAEALEGSRVVEAKKAMDAKDREMSSLVDSLAQVDGGRGHIFIHYTEVLHYLSHCESPAAR